MEVETIAQEEMSFVNFELVIAQDAILNLIVVETKTEIKYSIFDETQDTQYQHSVVTI